MNYSKLYNSIIINAKSLENERKILKYNKDFYFETHHIIPKSSGGSNDESNLVILTAREHFICHWILYKINPSSSNAFSWWMMSNNNGNKFHKERSMQSSRKYEYARKAFRKHIVEINTGRTYTEEQKKKYSLSKMGDKNHMFGKLHSEEHKAYLSEINKGEKNSFFGKKHTEESRKKMSDAKKQVSGKNHPRFGIPHSEETKKKLSDANRGKPRVTPHEIVKCTHCQKEGIKPNMKRWHFDNCKNKENINE